MKGLMSMNEIMRGMLLVALTSAVLACGGDDSMASKSAAAYREAQAKGIPVGGGHDHGGHQASTATSGTSDPHAAHDMTAGGTADHGAHGTMSAAGHVAMGHGAADHAQHGTTSSASGGHQGHGTAPAAAAADQHAGMQHGATTAGSDPHAQHRQPAAGAQMDHAQHRASPAVGTDPHAQHMMAGGTAAPIAATAPRSNAEMRKVQPATTLQADVFDAPAAISVSEAAKATQGGGHEGHQMRGITPGEDRQNPPTPMPATRERTNTSAPPIDHSQHGAAPPTEAKPATSVVYSCPMHPEVTSDKPGTCSKCGMALVKKN